MKTITSLRNLEKYGFKPLTGEACNLSMRILTDMTDQACGIFCECYGLRTANYRLTFEGNWNSGSGEIASVMLPPDAWQSLGVFALLGAGCHTVIQTEGGGLTGMTDGEVFSQDEWPSCYGKVIRIYRTGSHPHAGTRNVHAFTGRTV